MAKQPTDKCKFPSKKGGGWVTAAQFIVEELCILKKGANLPDKFWQLKEWGNFFRWQIKYANELLKEYNPYAITEALRDNRLKGLQSLSPRSAWKWKKVFDEYQSKYSSLAQLPIVKTEIPKVTEGDNNRPMFGKGGILGKL